MTQGPKLPSGISDRDRLAALDGYGVLDTPPEPGFDGIVILARALCAAPVALVSLVAEGRSRRDPAFPYAGATWTPPSASTLSAGATCS